MKTEKPAPTRPTTRARHEVHISEDNQTWYLLRPSYPDTPTGFQEATDRMKQVLSDHHFVRVARTVTEVTILVSSTSQQTEAERLSLLEARVRRALHTLPAGIQIYQRSDADFTGNELNLSPAYVAIEFSGKQALRASPPIDKFARRQWMDQVDILRQDAFSSVTDRLRKEKIRFRRLPKVLVILEEEA